MLNNLSYEGVIRAMRAKLIEQSEVKAKLVLNADSVRGQDLAKIIGLEDDKSISIDLSDTFILFELIEDNNSSLNYTLNDNDKVTMISFYKFLVRVYGNKSSTVAKKIIARFRSGEVVEELRDTGIYIVGLDSAENQKEFINNTLIPRRDLSIYIQTSETFNKVTKVGNFKEVQDIHLDIKDV